MGFIDYFRTKLECGYCGAANHISTKNAVNGGLFVNHSTNSFNNHIIGRKGWRDLQIFCSYCGQYQVTIAQRTPLTVIKGWLGRNSDQPVPTVDGLSLQYKPKRRSSNERS